MANFKELHLEQSTQEWLDVRKQLYRELAQVKRFSIQRIGAGQEIFSVFAELLTDFKLLLSFNLFSDLFLTGLTPNFTV